MFFVLLRMDSAACVLVLLMSSKPKTWEGIEQPPHDVCRNAMADVSLQYWEQSSNTPLQ